MNISGIHPSFLCNEHERSNDNLIPRVKKLMEMFIKVKIGTLYPLFMRSEHGPSYNI